jgi:hypothetical protein
MIALLAEGVDRELFTGSNALGMYATPSPSFCLLFRHGVLILRSSMAYWLVLSASVPGAFVDLPDPSLDAAHNVVPGLILI